MRTLAPQVAPLTLPTPASVGPAAALAPMVSMGALGGQLTAAAQPQQQPQHQQQQQQQAVLNSSSSTGGNPSVIDPHSMTQQQQQPQTPDKAKKKNKKKKKEKDAKEEKGKAKGSSINLNDILKETGIVGDFSLFDDGDMCLDESGAAAPMAPALDTSFATPSVPQTPPAAAPAPMITPSPVPQLIGLPGTPGLAGALPLAHGLAQVGWETGLVCDSWLRSR